MTLAPIYHEVTRLTAFNFLGQLEAFWGKLGQPGSNWAKSKTSTRYTGPSYSNNSPKMSRNSKYLLINIGNAGHR